MLLFIKNLAERYFEGNVSKFGDEARFSDFIIAHGTPFLKNVFPGEAFGFFKYVKDERAVRSERFRIQYFCCDEKYEAQKKQIIHSWFNNESKFLEEIWPVCMDDSSSDLVPTLCTSNILTNSTESMGAFIFECKDTIKNYGYYTSLNFEHLEMMSFHIGLYHGRVLDTKAQKKVLLSKIMDELSITAPMDASTVVPILRDCFEELLADNSFVELPDVQSGLSRLKELIDCFPDRLQEDSCVNPDCRVICHGNYSQAAGLFHYEGKKLISIEIGFWAKLRWSSLADDLIPLIFVDVEPSWSLEKRLNLVSYYLQGLRRGRPNGWIPNSEEVWLEIKHRIPVGLYNLARRIIALQKEADGSLQKENLAPWSSKYLTEVMKLLISQQFV